MKQFDGASGSTIATIAVAVNLVVTLIRNSGKIMFLKLLGLDKAIAKIPVAWLGLSITTLTTVATTLTSVAMGKDWGQALVEGLMAAMMAIGIHENVKPIKGKLIKSKAPKPVVIETPVVVETPVAEQPVPAKKPRKKRKDA